MELAAISTASGLEEAHWKKESTIDAGLISWTQGEQLYAAAREMLVAAAKASRERRMYHGNASAHVAKSFLSSCLMGQTQVGSFIITAHAPRDRSFHFAEPDELRPVLPGMAAPDSTSGAQIMSWLETALDVTRSCLDAYRKDADIRVFDEAVPQGLSFEFARALGSATRDSESAVKLIRPNSAKIGSTREFSFAPDEASVLESVANRFAQAYEPQEVTLSGEVAVLQHESSTEDRIVRIITEGRGRFRKVRLRLQEDQYIQAIEAHRQDRKLTFTGKLEREGNLNWIYSPRNVRMEEVSEVDDIESATYDEAVLPLWGPGHTR